MQKIQKQINSFISHCRYEKNLSQKTIKAYSIDLYQFNKYLFQNYNAAQSIDKQILRSYIQSIASFKPKTIKRKIASMKTFFNFLEYEDEILVNPFRKLKIQIREPKLLPNVMNLAEIEQMLVEVYSDKNEMKSSDSYGYSEKIRNIAILELLFATGARVSEISNLKKNCVDLINCHVKLKGKGNKERIIQICNDEVIGALKNYYGLFKTEIDQNEYFFINRFKNKLSEQSIRFSVKRCAKNAGIARNITPHVFRHSFATLLLEEDVDIKYIQHLLGHSSIITTQIYTHVNPEKQKKILTQNHPRENFQIAQI